MDLFNYEDELCENCRCYNESSLSLWLDCTGLGLGEIKSLKMVYGGIHKTVEQKDEICTNVVIKQIILLEVRKSSYSWVCVRCALLPNYVAEVLGVASGILKIKYKEKSSFDLNGQTGYLRCCGQNLQDSFETYKTFPRCIITEFSAQSTFKIINLSFVFNY